VSVEGNGVPIHSVGQIEDGHVGVFHAAGFHVDSELGHGEFSRFPGNPALHDGGEDVSVSVEGYGVLLKSVGQV